MPDKEFPPTQQQSGDEQGQPSQMKQENDKSGQQQQPSARREWSMPPLWKENPFTRERISTEMDRIFEAFGKGRDLLGSRFGRSGEGKWSPEIEMYERDNQLVVCVDLPGMKKDDIRVEITNEALIIQGERRQEFVNTQGKYQRSERIYGSFSRTISLPKGIDPEQMQASFQDGVLKVTMPLPSQEQQQQSRRIEIQGKETS